MKNLVETSGATVLIVSHALDQILRYCDECIWIERGRIIMRGASLEVVKAYERFIREMDERRLKAKNRKRLSGKNEREQLDIFSDTLTLSFELAGQQGVSCDISDIDLLSNETIEDSLEIGEAQDSSASQSASVVLAGSQWSNSIKDGKGEKYRSLSISPEDQLASGSAVFRSYMLFENVAYSLQVRYRCPDGNSRLALTVARNDKVLVERKTLPVGQAEWETWRYQLPQLKPQLAPKTAGDDTKPTKKQRSSANVSRWPSEGSLTIEDVSLLGADGLEQHVFRPEMLMSVSIRVRANKNGAFDVRPVLALFRLDGILISKLQAPTVTTLELDVGQEHTFYFDFEPLNLGKGDYIFSVALYQNNIVSEECYDLLDRTYEFKVIAQNSELIRQGTIFHHPGQWRHLKGET